MIEKVHLKTSQIYRKKPVQSVLKLYKPVKSVFFIKLQAPGLQLC